MTSEHNFDAKKVTFLLEITELFLDTRVALWYLNPNMTCYSTAKLTKQSCHILYPVSCVISMQISSILSYSIPSI